MFKNKWLLKVLVFVLILGTYISFAATSVNKWKKEKIKSSPIVYITKTGEKYHRAYHYHRRNYPISLFIADEKGYVPCKVCRPPYPQIYDDVPKFYLYNWLVISISFAILYWVILLLYEKKLTKYSIL